MTSLPPPSLHVIAVVRDPATARLVEHVLADSGDQLSLATDLAEGLARAASEAPDLVLVEIGIGENAGLAVVHHVRALAPRAAVYALAGPGELELASQALALGSTSVFMLPLAGDELLGALGNVRTRLAEQQERGRLERELRAARLAGDLLDALDAVGDCASRRQGARKILDVFVKNTGARRGAVFLRAAEDSRDLMLTEQIGELPNLPTFCEEMELMRYGADSGAEIVRLAGRTSQQGVLVLADMGALGNSARAALERAAAQAATLLALSGEREAASRGTMKDPGSSAYTFAYFVDVAGREIDKARRHGRRFALATLTVDAGAEISDSVQLAEHVLASVRDTDILARVDETEFYLLLPETGGIGAHSCRRRMMRKFRNAAPGATLSVGIATYPHDGADLSQLLRVARCRADACKESVVLGLELASLELTEVLEALRWRVGRATGVDAPRLLELPRADVARLAATAVGEARRSGAAWAVATERPGLSLSSAVRAALGGSGDNLRLDCADASVISASGDLEAFSVITEHGAYSLLGRLEGDRVRAVHTADPLFSDFLVDRLGELAGTRFWSS